MYELLLILFSTSTFAVLSLGFLLGIKHATEADHLAAVSTMVAERKNIWSSAMVGGLWGLGHTISLFLAGIFVLVLNFQITELAARWLEFTVGIMLTLLGLNVLRKLLKGGHLHFHAHKHGENVHAHPHLHERAVPEHTETHQAPGKSPRAILIGMVHGLAGSSALMLIVIPTIADKTVGLLYIVIFGIGSIGGMVLMSFLVGLPFHLTASRFNRFNRILQTTAGVVSITLGLWIVYEKGFSEGLFI